MQCLSRQIAMIELCPYHSTHADIPQALASTRVARAAGRCRSDPRAQRRRDAWGPPVAWGLNPSEHTIV